MSEDHMQLHQAAATRRLSRRVVLRGMAVASAALGGSLLAACQPAAAPAPTAAPAKPAATQAPAAAATQAPAAAAGNAVTSVKVGAAVAEKNKTPYVGVAFALYSIHQQGYRYLFSPFPKSPLLTKAIFDLMDTLNPKPARVAIFAEKTDWGAEMQNGWKQQAQSHSGFEVVVEEQYAPGSTDFSSMLLKAKSANPDAVLMVPTPPDGIAIVKQMKELDVNPKLVNIIRA